MILCEAIFGHEFVHIETSDEEIPEFIEVIGFWEATAETNDGDFVHIYALRLRRAIDRDSEHSLGRKTRLRLQRLNDSSPRGRFYKNIVSKASMARSLSVEGITTDQLTGVG
ncbi:hypothetical protein HG530_002801 [Fusarium avenaceum]|nr:hypothetical protein HG530_002801 [Fusarium avenaceum]